MCRARGKTCPFDGRFQRLGPGFPPNEAPAGWRMAGADPFKSWASSLPLSGGRKARARSARARNRSRSQRRESIARSRELKGKLQIPSPKARTTQEMPDLVEALQRNFKSQNPNTEAGTGRLQFLKVWSSSDPLFALFGEKGLQECAAFGLAHATRDLAAMIQGRKLQQI